MNFRKSGNVFIATVFLVFLNSLPSFADHKLRVGELWLGPGERLVILGIEANPEMRTPSIDFTKSGFKGIGMTHLNPKYLLEIDAY